MTHEPDEKAPYSASAIRHAAACYQAGRLDEAAEACAAVLAAYPGHFDAHYLAGLVKIDQGDPAAAIPLLTKAIKLRPRSPDAALNLSVALRAVGDAGSALAQSDRALALRPTFAEAHNNRGNALRALGRPHDALASYDQALAQRFDYADALNNRAAVLLDLGRAEEALASCTQAIALQSDFADAHFNRGNALRALGRYQRAIASYDEAVRYQPFYGTALASKSAILMLLNRHKEALAAARDCVARDPRQVDALINCGTAAQHLGRLAEAIAAYDAAIEIAPRLIPALRNRAAALRDLRRPAEALAGFDRLLEIEPDDADALCERGELLRSLGRLDESLASFDMALAIAPDHALAIGGAVGAALGLCDWAKAEQHRSVIERRIVDDDFVVSPFMVLGLSGSPAVQRSVASNFARTLKPRGAPPRRRPAARSHRIRIAFLSAHFGEHPFGRLIADLIEALDHTRFEAHGVCIGGDDGSDVRARLVDAFDHFHVVGGETDQAAADLLNAFDLDLAVDLTGYQPQCRPALLAARLAPIQVNCLGYPATMGADFIDYIIADPIVLPIDEQKFVTEQIVHLPYCILVNGANGVIAPETPSREAAGLPPSGFVFCSFNEGFNISRPVFDVWMRLLGHVDGSVLWLDVRNDAARDALRREATARGIDPGRLVFAELVSLPEHFARHRLADIFLDTLPCNARSTAGDALWAGVPALTTRGDAFAGRVGASMLTAAGLPDLIAPDLAAYEALALRLASEPDLLVGFRRRLDAQKPSSPLFDVKGFGRHLGRAFAEMHERHRRGAPPRSFAVDIG